MGDGSALRSPPRGANCLDSPEFEESEHEFWNGQPAYPAPSLAPPDSLSLRPPVPPRRNLHAARRVSAVVIVLLASLLGVELWILATGRGSRSVAGDQRTSESEAN